MQHDPINFWNGGPERPAEALHFLRTNGFPVADVPLPEARVRPLSPRGMEDEPRWRAEMAEWDRNRTAQVLDAIGPALVGLVTADAVTRAKPVEWRGKLGAESAVLRLAQEHLRLHPEDRVILVFAPPDVLVPFGSQVNHVRPPGGDEPLIKPRGYLSFMSATLALFPTAMFGLPVTVGDSCYALAAHMPSLLMERCSIGIHPRRDTVGVVGATIEQLAARFDVDAEPTFDKADWKTRLRLRRAGAAAKSDNQG